MSGSVAGLKEQPWFHAMLTTMKNPVMGILAGLLIAAMLQSASAAVGIVQALSMTGEITLRGKVLPIGGLKEKALAAYRIGIRTVIIPKANTKDLEEIPSQIRKQIEFVPVDSVSQVFERVIVGISSK